MNIINIRPQLKIAQINKMWPGRNFSNIPAMCFGRCNIYNICRLLIQFPITAIPEDAVIISAAFKFYVSAVGGDCPIDMTSYMITESWDYGTVTWNNQPTYDSNIYGDTTTFANCGQYIVDVTSIVQDWYAGNYTNNGIMLRSTEKVDKSISKIITESVNSYPPVIEIKYILKCVCQVECTQFVHDTRHVELAPDETFSLVKNTSVTKTVTFFVHNKGPGLVNAKLQISPDETIFIDDGRDIPIDPGNAIAMVPYKFAQYTRIFFSNDSSEHIEFDIFYQAQK